MKVRAHELAKKYGFGNKEFLEILNNIGIEIHSHMNGLTKDQEEIINEYFSEEKSEKTSEPTSEKKKELKNKKIVEESIKEAEDSIELEKKETISKENVTKIKLEAKSNDPLVIDAENLEDDFTKSKKKKRGRRADFVVKKAEQSPEIVEEDGMKIIKIRGEITLGDFAEKLGIGSSKLIKELFLKGQMLTINSPISFELAEELAMENNALVEQEEEVQLDFGDKFDLELQDKSDELVERAPVITIMGHVDHGKTSLLDAIRTTSVALGEAGGITQKIGAYQIKRAGKKITFIDTPGHEAFTDMRARGAQVTDIAILVVAADDGVKPQTIEALAHAKAANVPIIVAINKIDKPGADPMRVKQELMEHGLVSVELGGDTEFVEVSAKARQNLDDLLDTILITAEMLELTANPRKRAKGVVLESRLDPKIGPVADVLIQEGTLKIGEVIVAGECMGKVRALVNDLGSKVRSATVSEPVEIIGFNEAPSAGDTFYVIQNEQHAKRIVEEVKKDRKISEVTRKTISLETVSQQMDNANIKELNLILRADSRGSVGALRDSLLKLSTGEVMVNIIQATSGAITESDIKLAEASNAIIIGFNVRPTTKALKEAELNGVEIRTSNIIYHIIEDIEKALTGMLDPEFKEVYSGRIEIKKVFKVSKVGNIAGCIVVDGKVRKESNIRILRDGIIIYEGKLDTLKRYKDDAKEVVAGQECGLGIENFNDIKEGDIVEAFDIVEVKRTLK